MTFKKKGLFFIMALYVRKNTADMLGRFGKELFCSFYVLNGELLIQRKDLRADR
jgi:hypothetical protein